MTDIEIVLRCFDTLETLHRHSDDDMEKDLLRGYGLALLGAMNCGDIYRTPRTTEHFLSKEFHHVSCFEDTPQRDVVLLTSQDEPSGPVDLLVMFMRGTGGEVVGMTFGEQRRTKKYRFYPVFYFDPATGKAGVGRSSWKKIDSEGMPEEMAETAIQFYLRSLAYVNLRIEEFCGSGDYGDGVESHTILNPDFIMRGIPAWLRPASVTEAA